MRLYELIEVLTEIQESSEDAGEREVLFAIQPSYPLALEVHGVAAEDAEADDDDDSPIWLLASDRHPQGRSPYASRSLWDDAIVA